MLLYKIGQGVYGTVFKVKCRQTGKEFALKYHTRGVEESTVRELSLLTALKGHAHIVCIHDCFIHDGKIAMLMSYIPYTLSTAIHDNSGLYRVPRKAECSTPLSFVAHCSRQVADALSYMHALNIVHRDLTPFNVLLTEELTVKVADMGLSRQASEWMSPAVVTEPYRAPELFNNRNAKYTCTIDMWSLGVMIAEAMEGKVVFQHEDMPTYSIIVKTLGPRASLAPCVPDMPDVGPDTIMPSVMGCKLAKRIVLSLLAFRETERLLAHELLKDEEWTRVSHMTDEDRVVVRARIHGTGERVICVRKRQIDREKTS